MASDLTISRSVSRRGSFTSERSVGGPGDTDSIYSNVQVSTDPLDPSQRTWRNIIGYHNALRDPSQDVNFPPKPPSYEETTSRRLPGNSLQRSRSEPPPPSVAGNEVLPDYYCSVVGEGVADMKMEYRTPFLDKAEPHTEWKSVFIILRGTLFSVHQVKYPGLFSKDSGDQGESAGRLIRKYNLQHGEIGSAADHKKVEWVPRPGVDVSMADGYMQDDPSMFQPVRQYVLRLRLEGHQFLLRFKSSFLREEWLKIICGAIDIATDLDERSEPRHLTLPRRNRNRRQAPVRSQELQASSLMEEQERIIRQNFPHLAAGGRMSSAPDPDREDLDQGIFTRDAGGHAATGSPSSSMPQNLVARPVDPDFQVAPGKWSPRLFIDPVAELRARKQCMPVLLTNSRRHGEFIIQDNKRFKLDWEISELKPYPEEPPAYERRSKGSISDSKEHSKPLFRMRSSSGTGRSRHRRSPSIDAGKRVSAPPAPSQPTPTYSALPARPSSLVAENTADFLPPLVPTSSADSDSSTPLSPVTPATNRPPSVRMSRSPSNVILPSIAESHAQASPVRSIATANVSPSTSVSPMTTTPIRREGQPKPRPFSFAAIRRPNSLAKAPEASHNSSAAQEDTGLGIIGVSDDPRQDPTPLRSHPTQSSRPVSTAVDSRPSPIKTPSQRDAAPSLQTQTKPEKTGVWRSILRAFSGGSTGKKASFVVEKPAISGPIDSQSTTYTEDSSEATQENDSAARAQLFSERMYSYATHRKSRPISGISTTSAPETIYENEENDDNNSGEDESVAGMNSEERTSMERQKLVGSLRNQVDRLFWV